MVKQGVVKQGVVKQGVVKQGVGWCGVVKQGVGRGIFTRIYETIIVTIQHLQGCPATTCMY